MDTHIGEDDLQDTNPQMAGPLPVVEYNTAATVDMPDQSNASEVAPTITDDAVVGQEAAPVTEQTPVAPRRPRHLALVDLPAIDDDDTGTDLPIVGRHARRPDDETSVPATQPASDASQNETAAYQPLTVSIGTVPSVEPSETPNVPTESTTPAPVAPEAAPEPVDSEVRRRRLRKAGIVTGSVAGGLIVVYVAGSIFFTSHFLPHTTVNGEDVSVHSVANLAEQVTQIGASYTTHVHGDGLDLTIAGPDIAFAYDGATYSAQAAAQIPSWSWPFELGNDHTYQVNSGISFDLSRLEALVGGAIDAINQHATQPTNATMRYDTTQGQFVPVAQEYGTALDRAAVLDAVSNGLTSLHADIVLGDSELVQPTLWVDDERLTDAIARANALVTSPIVLRVAGSDATTLDPAVFASWITLDEHCNFFVNRDLAQEWASNDLSSQFDTKGTKRTFTRPDGKEIEVEGSEPDYDYGWTVDGEALANLVADSIELGKTDPIDVPMSASAAEWNPGGKEWPNRYIDVDISEQHVRLYDESSNIIWESDCVSGNPSIGGGTDTGVFTVYDKSSPATLRGLDYNGDGQPDYESHVNFWMPFDGGEGLHDATWRGVFGGEIYTYDGSHGCVNLPYAAAQELYDIVQEGDVVVVHE